LEELGEKFDAPIVNPMLGKDSGASVTSRLARCSDAGRNGRGRRRRAGNLDGISPSSDHYPCRVVASIKVSYFSTCTFGSLPEIVVNTDLNRITINSAVMNGQPCIRGTRLTVRRVLAALAAYPDRAELMREYPELEEEDIRQTLEFAARYLEDEQISINAA
jgi:uncharacterized protein (DUF433 family)